DLWISPNHAMYFEETDAGGVLIEAKDLINGVSIVLAERVEQIEYFHVELETHDVIIVRCRKRSSTIIAVACSTTRTTTARRFRVLRLIPRDIARAVWRMVTRSKACGSASL